MYNVNDLVAALQSGKTVEQIAAEMSETLNAAKTEADRLAAEKAAEEKKAADTTRRKRDLIINFYFSLRDYLLEFHPNAMITTMAVECGEPTAEDLDKIAEQVDSLVETFEAIKNLNALFGQAPTFTGFADPIEEFLNKNVRK